jgi:hypothetical protein
MRPIAVGRYTKAAWSFLCGQLGRRPCTEVAVIKSGAPMQHHNEKNIYTLYLFLDSINVRLANRSRGLIVTLRLPDNSICEPLQPMNPLSSVNKYRYFSYYVIQVVFFTMTNSKSLVARLQRRCPVQQRLKLLLWYQITIFSESVSATKR